MKKIGKRMRLVDVELLGVTVKVFHQEIQLALQPGLNIFYGLNGVGKSRLLDAIQGGQFHFKAPLSDGVESFRKSDPGEFEIDPFWPPIEFHYDGQPVIEYDFSFISWNDADETWSPIRDHELLSGVPKGPSAGEYFRQRILTSILDSEERWLFGQRTALHDDDWHAYLGYWLSNGPLLPPEEQTLVKEMFSELLQQGRVSATQINPTDDNPRWRITHSIFVSPDDAPATLRYIDYKARWLDRFLKRIAHDWTAESWATSLLEHVEPDFERFWIEAHEAIWHHNREKEISQMHQSDTTEANVDEQFVAFPLVDAVMMRLLEIYSEELDNSEFTEFIQLLILRETLGKREFNVFRHEMFGSSGVSPVRVVEADQLLQDPLDTIRSKAELLPVSPLFDTGGIPLEKVREAIVEIETAANELFQQLLLDAPPLSLQRTAPGDPRPPFVWMARDKVGTWVPIEEMSDTQLRLANLAINFHTVWDRSVLTVLQIDEPERGLHRLAEAHLRKGLEDLANSNDDLVIVATSHSPVFLGATDARLHHIARNRRGVLTVDSIERPNLEEAEQFGVPPIELLQLVRVVVLVEGVHDQWVLEELFGEELRNAGAYVIPIRGAKKLVGAADANLLFNFTDAHVAVMLDAVDQDRVEKWWGRALEAKLTGDSLDVVNELLQKIKGNRKRKHEQNVEMEYQWLIEFCQAAISKDREHRIAFSLLRKKDIEFYLDPRHFLTGIDPGDPIPTWESLIAEHERAKSTEGAPNFKKWLEASGRANFGRANWETACREIDSIHPDLVDTFSRILDAASEARN